MRLLQRSWNSARLAARIRRERRLPYASAERIDGLQRRRLRAIAGHACRSVPFYREAMRGEGLRPEDLERVEDLARLPLLDGVTVRRDVERFTSRAVGERVAMRSSGSGLTHVRTIVWWDTASQLAKLAIAERDRAVVGRMLGRSWGLRHLYVLPEASVSLDLRAWWDARILAPRGLAERNAIPAERPFAEVADRIDALRPDVVYSYGSFADRFFRHLAGSERGLASPGVWVYGGDTLPPDGRELIERGFGIPVLSTYQTVETGRLGFECEARCGFHLNVDFCAVRIVDGNGESVAPGTPGEVVVSNLFNRATVLLNYRLGDRAVLATGPCACGRRLPRLESLEGRVSEVVRLADGREISSMILRNLVKDELAFALQCQVVQPHPGKVVWRVVPLPGKESEEARRALQDRTRRLVGVETVVEFVDRIPVTSGGKHLAVAPGDAGS
ncbi:MAG: phenylacetate--CoA ligase family protein [Gemmatimonadota bacterium]